MALHGINRLGALLLSLGMAFTLCAQHLQEGDLLFCCNEAGNAITQVTSGVEHLPIDHVGIVHRIGGETGPIFVIEAIKPAVCITPLDTFLCRNTSAHLPQVVLGRVNVDMDMTTSIRQVLRMVGKPYDDVFLPGDSALYCSELVQLNYVSPDGEPIFGTIPMSFHDATNQVTEFWQQFYARRGMAVPEGAPGTNPGELSRRQRVSIIGKYPIHL